MAHTLPAAVTDLYPDAFAAPLPGRPGWWYCADRPCGGLIGMGEGQAAAIADAARAAQRLGIRQTGGSAKP